MEDANLAELSAHYSRSEERGLLTAGRRQLEFTRTTEILLRRPAPGAGRRHRRRTGTVRVVAGRKRLPGGTPRPDAVVAASWARKGEPAWVGRACRRGWRQLFRWNSTSVRSTSCRGSQARYPISGSAVASARADRGSVVIEARSKPGFL